MNLIIPLLLLFGFAVTIQYGSKWCSDTKKSDESEPNRPVKFTHPPMDLRLKQTIELDGNELDKAE